MESGVSQGLDEILERCQLDVAEIEGRPAHPPSVACAAVL
jgi:hypothetical protein